MSEIQVSSKGEIAGEVRQDRHRARGNDHQAYRQPIQPVGQINRVRRTYHHEDYKEVEGDEGQRVRPDAMGE